MAKDLQKLIDSNDSVSIFGRADRYQAEHPLKPRHSKDVVGGADSTLDQFAIIKQYHLKGFEYGNWVSNNDRYDHLLAAQRSLKHLAQILGSQNIGINGNVGIAFGGRGNGGFAAAHYEPSFNMINLTKPSGAGCLAHEYGHALDYNFGSFVDQHKSFAALSGGHSISQTLETNVGGQLRAMTNALLDAIIRTESHQDLRDAVKNKGDYWIRRTEIFARFFEQYICYKMRKISTDYYLTQTWEFYTHNRAYLAESDFEKVLPLAEKLNAELGKFLNGRGKLKTTPYPSTKKLVPVKKAAAKKAAPAKKPIKKAAQPKKVVSASHKPIYYDINESEARIAKDNMSFSEYKTNSATTSYRAQVDEAYKLAEAVREEDRELAYKLADRYAKRLAIYINKDNHIGAMYPSVMIAGPSKFNTKKKAKQVSMWDANHKYYQEQVEPILERLKRGKLTSDAIKSSDDDAVQQLEAKIAQLKKKHEDMKAVNAYYRKHKTLKGCSLISEKTAAAFEEQKKRQPYRDVPFMSYTLSNSLAEIKRYEGRLKQLRHAKSVGTHEKNELKNKYFRVVANSDIMRLQLFFDGVPESNKRDIIKRHGFKWSPANKAWQRVLNYNANYAVKSIIAEFDKL